MPLSHSEQKARFQKMENDLANLQRRTRRLVVCLGVVLALAGVVLFAQFNAHFQGRYTVEANKFLLSDPHGKPRATLDLTDETVRLQLYDGKGKPRAVLAVTPKGTAGISVLDAGGASRATLGINDDEPAFLLNDADAKPRVSIHLANEQPILRLTDDNEQDRLKLVLRKDGASLQLLDDTSTPRATLTLTRKGFAFTDATGKPIFAKP